MKHPMIVRSAALRIAEDRIVAGLSSVASGMIDDLSHDLADAVRWWGEDPRVEVSPLEEAQHKVEELLTSGSAADLDRDQIEGKAACLLYRALEDAGVETPALDDPGFWRYVCLAHFWNFVTWREPRAFTARRSDEGSQEAGENFKKYVDGHNSRECVPTRMYLRIEALGGLEHAHLAWAVRGGTDLWRSHILRVKAGEHPSLVRAVVRRQADTSMRLMTDDLRAFAKELNRTLTNLVPALLDDDAADQLVGELWERQLMPTTGRTGGVLQSHGDEQP